jgi:hypothetical protein
VVDLQFNSGADEGVFDGTFVVDSNDPVTASLTVPITITVDGAVDAPPVVAVPTRLHLHPSTPNPFGDRTEIRFDLPRPGPVALKVFDVAGRLVRTLVDGEEPAGFRAVSWDGTDDGGARVSAGVYFYTLETAGESFRRKMVRLR